MCGDYQLKKCSECGAQIPVTSCQDIVTCQFCGSQFDVVKTNHGRGIHGQEFPNTSGLLVGGLVGFFLGAVIFTNVGRGLARAAGARAVSYISPKD